MSLYDNGVKYCEDCIFYNLSIRPNLCSSPKNLKRKFYQVYTTRKYDAYLINWKNVEMMRTVGYIFSRLLNMCGRDARWFEPRIKR